MNARTVFFVCLAGVLIRAALFYGVLVCLLGGCASTQPHALAARTIVGTLGTVVEERGHAPTTSVEIVLTPPANAKRIGYLRIYPGAKACGDDVPEEVKEEGERIGASFLFFEKRPFGGCRADYFAGAP